MQVLCKITVNLTFSQHFASFVIHVLFPQNPQAEAERILLRDILDSKSVLATSWMGLNRNGNPDEGRGGAGSGSMHKTMGTSVRGAGIAGYTGVRPDTRIRNVDQCTAEVCSSFSDS